MLRLKQVHQFDALANVTYPDGKEATFTVKFTMLGVKEFNTLIEVGDVAALKAVIVGWADLIDDATDQEVPFNPDNLELLLDILPHRTALFTAYFKAITEGARKNS